MTFLSIIYWVWTVSCAATLVKGVLLALNTWENRRFSQRRVRNTKSPDTQPHVAILAPCKGLDLGLAANLAPLLRQDYLSYEVLFIVESPTDPALPVIQDVIAQHPRSTARIVVAGRATDIGQKIHNLSVAASQLDEQVQIVAFVDSDVRPAPGWLGKLVTRLNRAECGAVTGYRWFVPQQTSLANSLLCSINASLASLLGAGGQYIVWGGSWAIRRSDFERLQILQAWRGTISDDLVATRAIKVARLPIEFEPICMTSSPIDYSMRGMLSFLRRQHQIGRIYVPGIWYQSLGLLFMASFAVVGAMIGLACWIGWQAEWAWFSPWFLAAWYGLQMYRGWLRVGLSRLYVRHWSRPMMWAALFDVLGAPLSLLINTAVMCGACFGNRISWRGITYDLRRDGTLIRVLQPVVNPRSRSTEQGTQLRVDPAQSPGPVAVGVAQNSRSVKSWNVHNPPE